MPEPDIRIVRRAGGDILRRGLRLIEVSVGD